MKKINLIACTYILLVIHGNATSNNKTPRFLFQFFRSSNTEKYQRLLISAIHKNQTNAEAIEAINKIAKQYLEEEKQLNKRYEAFHRRLIYKYYEEQKNKKND